MTDHEEAVKAFLAEAQARDPERFKEVARRHKVLEDARLARIAKREVRAFGSGDERIDSEDPSNPEYNEPYPYDTPLTEHLREQQRTRAKPVSEQDRVWAMHEQGVSYAAIAEATGKAVGTVKATLAKARKARGVYRSGNSGAKE